MLLILLEVKYLKKGTKWGNISSSIQKYFTIHPAPIEKCLNAFNIVINIHLYILLSMHFLFRILAIIISPHNHGSFPKLHNFDKARIWKCFPQKSPIASLKKVEMSPTRR
jgi:hypothetical protein